MAQTINDIKAEIEHKGEEITHIAHQIEDRIEEIIDWKGMVESKPLTTIAASVGVGLLFAGALNPIMRFILRQAGMIAQASLMALLVEKLKEREEANQTTQYASSSY